MEYRLISSLDKVFPDRQLSGVSAPLLTALQGETVSLQLAAKNAEGTAVLWPRGAIPLGRTGAYSPGGKRAGAHAPGGGRV